MPSVKTALIDAAWAAMSRMNNEADNLEAQSKSLRKAAKRLHRELDPPETNSN